MGVIINTQPSTQYPDYANGETLLYSGDCQLINTSSEPYKTTQLCVIPHGVKYVRFAVNMVSGNASNGIQTGINTNLWGRCVYHATLSGGQYQSSGLYPVKEGDIIYGAYIGNLSTKQVFVYGWG